MKKSLSKDDVTRLLANPSADTRVDVVSKLAKDVDGGALTAEERAIAEDILRVLSRDAALRVRQALAQQLKESHSLPHDVAMALAHDVEEVALPVLNHSAVLSDAGRIHVMRDRRDVDRGRRCPVCRGRGVRIVESP